MDLEKKEFFAENPTSDASSSASSVTGSDPITYHYLEWHTPLPAPSSHRSDTSTQSDPPPTPPDLNDARFANPLDWPEHRKRVLIYISCLGTMFTAYAAGSYEAGTTQMEEYWHISHVAAQAGVTMFTTGFAIAPMVLAPFSEINGRRPVFLITGILYFLFLLCCAWTHLFWGMLVSRLLKGLASSTFSTMVGGVVSDIYRTKDQNTPMSLFTASALFGTGLGPLVSSLLAQYYTWRWIFWAHAIVVGILMIVIYFFFRESRGTVLLSRRAAELNRWYAARERAGYYGVAMPVSPAAGDPNLSDKHTATSATQIQRIRWKVRADEDRASLLHMIHISLKRPFHMLLTESVVFWFSCWISFAWTILYLQFSVIPYTFRTVYGFSLQETGAVFAAISAGAILGHIMCVSQDKLAQRYLHLDLKLEGRLKFVCFETLLMPIGLFWFGWSSAAAVHWIVPALAIGVSTMGIFAVYLAVFNYLADSYHRYASSAIAAQSFCRNIVGGIFPLFSEQMFIKMGLGGGSSLLGGVGIGLTAIPWVLMLFGPRIRARSKFASELLKEVPG